MTLNRHDLEIAAIENLKLTRHISDEVARDIGYTTREEVPAVIDETLARVRQGSSEQAGERIVEAGPSTIGIMDNIHKENSRRQPKTPKPGTGERTGTIDRRRLTAREKLLADQAPKHIRHNPYS